MSIKYFAAETGTNLWRNRLMSLAAIFTVAISLSLVGSALLIKQGVSTATAEWKGNVQLLVFLQPKISPTEFAAVEDQLHQLPAVKSFSYVPRAQAYADFRRLLANQPDLVNAVPESAVPTFLRVSLVNPAETRAVAAIFQGQPGVDTVNDNFSAINTITTVSNVAQTVILAVAIILLVSAAVLILNVIRVAIFSRRREVAVMRLVGATNSFIQIPFMLEGLVQGLIGALVATGVVILVKSLIGYAISHFRMHLLEGFVLTSHNLIETIAVIVVAGVVVGTLGSTIAVRRFLAA
ncbi:permease-like cell division protein FtsX [Ferrimicrobium sp.]|uniref:cell division protein FtsX n=1 Tax=Ferrimicrobium sp. TaxID=2926050 RepID=UPI00261A07D3|nr:permease-like cell division protein FtsX [Ferrimicrobium sp.]